MTDNAKTTIPTEQLGGRTCATCACYFAQINPEDPKQSQGFCRRNGAKPFRTRAQRQQVIKGEPRFDRNTGAPILESFEITGMMYDVTDAGASCFDGWRPQGVLPGERTAEVVMRQIVPKVIEQIPGMPPGLQTLLRGFVAGAASLEQEQPAATGPFGVGM